MVFSRFEEASDGGEKFCFVQIEFFGDVEAGGVGEGGGEVVGCLFEWGEGGAKRDGDDGVFNSGGGEDSAVEVEEEVGGWGRGKG